MTAWKRAAKLWREAAQVWRQTVIEREGVLVELQKQVFERDKELLAMSMRLGAAEERAMNWMALCYEADVKGMEYADRAIAAEKELTANSHRRLFPAQDDGGRREISNDGQY